ncbi:unnamed protein product [Phaeothamnion confervicola]
MSGTPAWLRPEPQAAERVGLSPVESQQHSYGGPPSPGGPWRLGFRICSITIAVLMIIASFVALGNLSVSDGFTTFFLCIYIWLFSGILMTYEMQGFVRCEGVDSSLRKYFGLVYGTLGRGIFMIFIAFLNFALENTNGWGVAVGILTLIEAAAMITVFLQRPHLLDDTLAPAAAGGDGAGGAGAASVGGGGGGPKLPGSVGGFSATAGGGTSRGGASSSRGSYIPPATSVSASTAVDL